MRKISIVIAVHNEESNVAILTESIHLALEKQSFSYEIIFVDDGSTDRTARVLKEMRDPYVKLIILKRNYGQCPSLKAGIDMATGDYIATLDGDLQNDPKDLIRMFSILELGMFDFVTGIRKKRRDRLILRVVPSQIANWLIRVITNTNIKDNGCGIKMFKSQIIKEIPLYGEFHRFISILAMYEGAKGTQITVNHFSRISGKSKYGLTRIVKVLSDLVLLRFYRKYAQKPMHFFGRTGLLFSIAGTGILTYLIIQKIMGMDIWGRPILFLGILLLILGFQIILSGIVLDYLMRTYYESQQKKPYNIKSIDFGQKENSKSINILA
jgi:glycosyltransferase involved in cell wall biosynthesis